VTDSRCTAAAAAVAARFGGAADGDCRSTNIGDMPGTYFPGDGLLCFPSCFTGRRPGPKINDQGVVCTKNSNYVAEKKSCHP